MKRTQRKGMVYLSGMMDQRFMEGHSKSQGDSRQELGWEGLWDRSGLAVVL